MAGYVRDYQHVVIDTEGNPSDEDFRELAEGCDLMVIPAEPETVATDGLIHTLEKLQALKSENHRLLTGSHTTSSSPTQQHPAV